MQEPNILQIIIFREFISINRNITLYIFKPQTLYVKFLATKLLKNIYIYYKVNYNLPNIKGIYGKTGGVIDAPTKINFPHVFNISTNGWSE
jgi:hypothetical protein